MSKKRGKNRTQKKPPAAAPVEKAAPAQPAAAARKPFPVKTAAIAAVMLICVAAGAWFVLSPTLEKNRMLEQQNALLDSIEQGEGEIVLDAVFAAADVDFYDSEDETTEPDTPAATEAERTTEPEAAPD